MSSWDVDPEVLIIEVESRPLLYAKALPEYSNKLMKNNAWENITKKLSEDWDTLTNEQKNNRSKDVQTKWKHLRDNFRREYQAQKHSTSGQGAKKRKKYRYYDVLLFLLPHIQDAKTSGNYSTPTNPEQNTNESQSTSDSVKPAGSSTVTSNIPETPIKKKQKKSSFEDEVLKAINCENSEPDEDKAFCLSLVQSLKKMNDDKKMLAKIEILKVIHTFTNKSLNTNNSQSNRSPYIEPYFTTPNSTFIYTQTPQKPSFTQSHMYQQHLTKPKPVIKILENRQYCPSSSTAPNCRPHSAQSFFNSYNPNICPSPSDQSNSTYVQSPLSDVKSPEEMSLSLDGIIQSPLSNVNSPEEMLLSLPIDDYN